jgi:hypothetical protein
LQHLELVEHDYVASIETQRIRQALLALRSMLVDSFKVTRVSEPQSARR